MIPALGRAHTLAKVLPTYLSQPDVFEIVIVDDGSPTPLEHAVPAAGGPVDSRVRYVRHVRTLGSCAARNTGVREARAELVMIGEDDVELGENCIRLLLEGATRHDAAIVSPRLLVQEHPNDSYAEVLRQNEQRRKPGQPLKSDGFAWLFTSFVTEDTAWPFSHAIILAPKQLFESILFDTRIGGPTFMREDHEFQLCAASRGFLTWVIAGADCMHYHHLQGEGGGTRVRQRSLRRTVSAMMNTYEVLSRYEILLQDYFDSSPPLTLATRAAIRIGLFDLKRQLYASSPAAASMLIRLRQLVQRSP